jgi:hypothetical protein
MAKKNIRWEKRPDKKDYDAALNYLSLIYPTAHARKLVKSLYGSKMIERAAKDLLRASGLPLLSREEPHVNDDLTKIRKGKPLSPVLLIQGDLTKQIPLIVADGYHRICAICYYDENTPIPCCMAYDAT